MSTQLRDMFDAAAESEVPNGMAERAVGAARQRRRQRYVVGGAVLATAAVVLGVVVAVSDVRMDAEPRPTEVASLPPELPAPSDLPELTAGVIDAASTAYVIDEELVLVGAQSDDAYVFNGTSEMAGLDTGGIDAEALRPYQVRLSPDGTTALVAMRFESSQRLPGIRLAVLDVATAESSLEDLQLSDAYAETAWLEYNLMSWAPDSKSAFCVCLDSEGTPELGIWGITIGETPEGAFYFQVADHVPAQISAGHEGLAVQFEPYGGSWELRGYGPLGRAASLSLSIDNPTASALPNAFAMVASDNDGYAIEEFVEQPQPTQWRPMPAGPVSSLQSYGSDYVLVSRPEEAAPGEPAPPAALLAHVISDDSEPLLLTSFPGGTTSTSFAADLADAGQVNG